MKEGKRMKKRLNDIIKSKKGITLIVLVITIVIMLILTGISINLLFGDNGIITNSKLAKKEKEKSEIKEKVQEKMMVYCTENVSNNATVDKRIEETLYGFWELYNGKNEDNTPKYPEYYDPEFIIYLFEENALLNFVPTLSIYSAQKVYTKASVFYKGYQTDIDDKFNITRGPLSDYDMENEQTEEEDGDVIPPRIVEQITATPSENKIDLSLIMNDLETGYAKVVWYHKLSGASEYTNQTETIGEGVGSLTNVTVTQELTNMSNGTYDIYAKVYDVAGNFVETDTVQATVFFDNTPPEITTNSFTATAEGSYINLGIGAIDTISGLQRVEWYHRTVGGEYEQTVTDYDPVGLTTQQTKTSRLGGDEGLLDGTYEVYAKVYDVAGNYADSNVKTVIINTAAVPEVASGEWNEEKGVNQPFLKQGMLPVKYDESENKWKVCTASDTEWFSYVEQDGDLGLSHWANIMFMDEITVIKDGVTLTNDEIKALNRDENSDSRTPEAVAELLDGAIVTKNGSMFVWIPRYEYKISGISIDINFLPKTTTYEKNTSRYQISSEGYCIHPAFTDDYSSTASEKYANGGGSSEISGFWVGKFECSSTNPTTSYGGYSFSGLKIRVVPGVQSWRNYNINAFYDYCLMMSDSDWTSYYGKTTTGTTHLIKNSEWGAVAYLTESAYGRDGNEISINTSSGYITGSGSGSTSTTTSYSGGIYAYNGATGVTASTTKNVYGVYDMSGGVAEYVGAFGTIRTGVSYVHAHVTGGDSGLYSTVHATKYKNPSSTSNAINAQYCKMGDAMAEFRRYGDTGHMPYTYSVYLVRGGAYNKGSGAGIFYSENCSGSDNEDYGFRVTMKFSY